MDLKEVAVRSDANLNDCAGLQSFELCKSLVALRRNHEVEPSPTILSLRLLFDVHTPWRCQFSGGLENWRPPRRGKKAISGVGIIPR